MISATSKYCISTLHFTCLYIVLVLEIFFGSVAGLAQGIQIGFSNVTPSSSSGHDYIQQLSETVNPANGSLNIHIQIPTPHGRALSFGYGLNYDSAAQFDFTQPLDANGLRLQMGLGGAAPFSGWTDTMPRLIVEHDENPIINANGDPDLCEVYESFIFVDPKGERHGLPLLVYVPSTVGAGCYPNSFGTPILAAADKDYQAVFDGGIKIASADGTVYQFELTFSAGVGAGFPPGIIAINPEFIKDKNGNMVSIGNGSYAGCCMGSGSPMIDTLGRTLVSTATTPKSDTSLVPDLVINIAGSPAPYKFTTTQEQVTASSIVLPTQPNNTLYGNLNACGGLNVANSDLTTRRSITNNKIEMPNGQSYIVGYDPSYGYPNKITYPSGAYTSYTWSVPGYTDDASYSWQLLLPTEPPPAVQAGDNPAPFRTLYCFMQYGLPAISHREVSFDGINVALTQDFSYNTTFGAPNDNSGWKTKSTTVTTRDLTAGTSSIMVYTYIPDPDRCSSCNISNGLEQRYTGPQPVENSVTYEDGSGNILKTVKKTFSYGELVSEVTSLPSSLTSEQDYFFAGWAPPVLSSYASSFLVKEQGFLMLPSGTAIYDWGLNQAGPLLTKTYDVFDTNNLGTTSITLNEFPTILDTPTKTITVDSYNNTVAETDYVYTDMIASPLYGIIQHDSTYEGGTPQVRRNLLAATKKCFARCNDSTTTYGYDSTGQVVSRADGYGNTMTMSYLDAFASGTGQPSGNTNAYLTSSSAPPTTGISHVSSATYGFNDGKMRSSTDENQQTTHYCYATGGCSGNVLDPLLRLTQVLQPDGGNSLSSYNDAGPNPSVVRTTAQSNTANITTTAVSDGMGHLIQTQVNSAPGGNILVDVSYNGLGQVFTKSNPHRGSSWPTDGTSQYQYDALGRITSITHQDGASSHMLYCDNGTYVTDESGNIRKTTTDSAGRLISVWEQILSPASCRSAGLLNTVYTYDAIGNLTKVNQQGSGGDGARTRSFTYDSLSRLICASNPENSQNACPASATATMPTGVILYSYDTNGNVHTKTDARGLTTTYSYDAINRLVSKTYPPGTASSCYQYDTSSLGVTGGNLIGRLTNSWTQSSVCPDSAPAIWISSTVLSRHSFLAYDSMGRVLREQQCTRTNCMTGSPFATAYDYDLSGNLVHYGNGVSGIGAISFTNCYDGANHVSLIAGVSTNCVSPNYPPFMGLFTSPVYTAPGGLSTANFGAGLQLTRTYDSRLRITGEIDMGNAVAAPTPATATISIIGTNTGP